MVESKDRIHTLEERTHDLASILRQVASSVTLPEDLQAQVEDVLSEVNQHFVHIVVCVRILMQMVQVDRCGARYWFQYGRYEQDSSQFRSTFTTAHPWEYCSWPIDHGRPVTPLLEVSTSTDGRRVVAECQIPSVKMDGDHYR